MPASVVGERATGTATSGSGTTQAVTVASDCSSGNTICLLFGASFTATAGFTVTDSKGNTWTIDAGPFLQGTDFVFIASTRQDVGVLLTGDIITVHFPSAMNPAKLWFVEEISGLLMVSYVDKVASNANAARVATGNSGATAATTQADEIALAAFCAANFSTTGATTGAGYNQFASTLGRAANVTDYKALYVEYKILSAAGVQSADMNFNTTGPSGGPDSYIGCIVTYKAVASVASHRHRMLRGVG